MAMAMFPARITVSVACVLLLGFGISCAHADSFGSGFLSKSRFTTEFAHAVGSVLGCGGQPDENHVKSVKSILTPMWQTLPKTSGRIDRRTLRYLVHRYFVKSSSMMVVGFEPSRSTNVSDWGAAKVLSQMVPGYVESVLESEYRAENGFTLQDAVDMVLTIDQLIFDAESRTLEYAYAMQAHDFVACHDSPGFVDEKGNECIDRWEGQDCSTAEELGYTAEGKMDIGYHCRRTCGLCAPGKPTSASVTFDELKEILRAYVLLWLVDTVPADHAALFANATYAAEVLNHYGEIVDYFQGRIKALERDRLRKMSSAVVRGHGGDILSNKYSFDDAHEIIGGVTRNFQSFWQSECRSMKDALVRMDAHYTGRVPLSKFYNFSVGNDWIFDESESYLRELGALDETSYWLGPQIIIPNYIQGTSNCIVSTPYYLICCQNECETLLQEIEQAINAPTALPSKIIEIVNGSQITTQDDDEPTLLSEASKQQLDRIASNHRGTVPLHGRLFAQWLHYVFPRECPFPFKSGSTFSATPSQYGEKSGAVREDMERHASLASSHDAHTTEEISLEWLSQWSEDEELMADYSSELPSSPERQSLLIFVGMLFVVGGVISHSGDKKGACGNAPLPSVSHAHLV